MKKFIFIATIFFGAGFLIVLSFSKNTTKGPEVVASIDFSEGERLYSWNANKKSFVDLIGSGTASPSSAGLYFHQLSPIDGIYYRSSEKKPFIVEKRNDANIVTFGTGLFICNFQTGLEKYEFRTSDLTITPKGHGIFLIDTTHEEISIFSFDTFLDTVLTNGPKRDRIASLAIFPGLLFKHDLKNTLELKEADILRISIIDSIRYVDLKTPGNMKMLFAPEDSKNGEEFLTEVQEDIIAKTKATSRMYDDLSDGNVKKLRDSSFFSTSSSLLINGSKKEVVLKNALLASITEYIRNPKKSALGATIRTTLSDMKDLNEKTYQEGLAILRQYYYITSFADFSEGGTLIDAVSEEAPVIALAEDLLSKGPKSRQNEYYRRLSNIFSAYYFNNLKTEELNAAFEKNLQQILSSKVLAKEEFLPFVFFVTQYLSTGPVLPNEDTLLTIAHLFQITNDYYAHAKSDEKKLATITSTTFYNYTKIFGKLLSVFLDTYIDKTPEGLLFKKEYLDGETTTFSQSFSDSFIKVLGQVNKDVDSKKDILYAKGSFQSDSQVVDSYTLLKSTLKSFDTPMSMLGNYQKYLNDFHLNDSNRSARGILIEKGNEMSLEILGNYLKNFNNLDISTLTVANNFQKDGFYDVQVSIFGNIFSFKLWEQNHVLADISYTDTFGKKRTFPDITIPLDQKKQQLDELMGGASEPEEQYRYDFKNFFEITFMKGDSTSVADTTPVTTVPDTGSDNPEIRLFVQKNLLDMDFKNIRDFLPIEFRNISASIGSGTYLIDLHDIHKGFAGADTRYSTDLSGKYIFNRHTFSRMSLKVRFEGDSEGYEFNNTPIEILPARISLLSAPDTLKDIGYYLDAIKRSYRNQQSLIIDLTGKKVLLDNTPVEVIFPTP